MDISIIDASRLQELYETIQTSLEEFKDICKESMTQSEYEQFKHRCLGHLEQAVTEETEWMPDDGIDSLQVVAERALEDCEQEEQGEEEG